ncbi:MAG: Fic family protein [Nitrospinae bacterium]|nr:Fic family protein [Nitrospinota bacterium]
MDWRKFRFEYHYEPAGLTSTIISIEASKEAAMSLILPPEWGETLNKLNRVRAIHGTTAIEGNPLSEAEVSQQIEAQEQSADHQDATQLSKEQIQIRNAGAAQTWVQERFKPGSDPFTLSDILIMHKMITENADMTDNTPGQLRAFSVQVGSPSLGGVHRGAPHEELPGLMNEYIEFLRARKMEAEHPAIRALLAHFFLVTIHPFGDGNGRTSRLVEAGILFRGEYNVHGFYGLSNYFYRHDDEYKRLLQKCREEQPFNVTPFIAFGLQGFMEELKGINNFIKTKLNRIVYRNMLVQARNKKISERRYLINDREYGLLDFLISETEPLDPFSEQPSKSLSVSELFESPYIRGAYKEVSTRTFFRELVRLEEFGFLKLTDTKSDGWIMELDFDAIGKY